MNAKEIIKQLIKNHPPDKYAFFGELRVGTGFGPESQQSLDAFAVNFFKSKRNASHCYEIKISRSDFFTEIKKPLKRRAGLRFENRFSFVTPKGLVKIEEVPPECGLIEVNEDGTLTTVVEAPYKEAKPTWLFIASIFRRLDKKRFLDSVEGEKEKEINKMYYIACMEVLKQHIEKWQNYSIGNKAVPDMIAKELANVYHEINDVVAENLK